MTRYLPAHPHPPCGRSKGSEIRAFRVLSIERNHAASTGDVGVGMTAPDPKPPVAGTLEVGLTADGREIVINHPALQPDANGCGHIVFSAKQARALAALLNRKADEVDP